MKRISRVILFALSIGTLFHIHVFAQLKAFPTAEGYGRFATGGRGGEVYVVTNLNNAGAGSLRDACEKRTFSEGNVVPRTVVFNVSGTIELDCGDRGLKHLRINEPFLTIAGQSAPGGGICIVNQRDDGSDERTQQKPIVAINTSDVIVRHIRIRNQSENAWVNPNGCCPYESFGCVRIPAWGEAQGDISDIIMDHCSMAWASDDIYWTGSGSTHSTSNITLQYCLFYEAFHHGRAGMMSKTTSGTYYRNVVGSAIKRNLHAEAKSTPATFGLINNIVYNWRYYGTSLWSRITDGKTYKMETNVLCNYWIPGPESGSGNIVNAMSVFNDAENPADPSDNQVYVDNGNIGPTRTSTTQNPWDIMTMWTYGGGSKFTDCRAEFQSTTRFDTDNLPPDSVIETDVEKLHDLLLGTSRQGAGAFPWSRDQADKDFIQEMRERKGSSLGESTVPRYPNIAKQTRPDDYDTDRDGMADVWESDNGLDTTAADHNGHTLHPDYTNLEVYLNDLAGDIEDQPVFSVPRRTMAIESADGPTGNLYSPHGRLVARRVSCRRTWSAASDLPRGVFLVEAGKRAPGNGRARVFVNR